ncbi:MAG: hypothetical protein ACK5LO_14385 [Leucobacter sp.]
MSDDRETHASRAAETPENSPNPGAPVEETEASRTEVLEAVERATGSGGAGGSTGAGGSADGDAPAKTEAAAEGVIVGEAVVVDDRDDGEATEVVVVEETRVGSTETAVLVSSDAEESALVEVDATETDAVDAADGAAAATEKAVAESKPSDKIKLSETDLIAGPKRTSPKIVVTEPDTKALPPLEVKFEDTPPRDGEIRISPDHPMASLYTQTPLPPEPESNRGMGVLISIVAALGFAVVSAGVLALWLAPQFPPSTFWQQGLLPMLLSFSFIGSVVAFFVGLAVLVLIVGRAGWWAYAIFGFFVAAFVWAATVAGLAANEQFAEGSNPNWNPASLIAEYGLSVQAIVAAIVAREASIWFGAWIGFRGRRVKQRNAEATAEYEQALSEVQAKQP